MSLYPSAILSFFVSASLAVSAHANIRDYYEEPGLNPFKETINQNFGEHIDPFSGQLQLSYTDLVVPGNGGAQTVWRAVLRSNLPMGRLTS